MKETVRYDKTVMELYDKTEEIIDEVKFDLVYYILVSKCDVDVDGLEPEDVFGIQINMINLNTNETETQSEIDIWTDRLEVESLADRLLKYKALPCELHDTIIDYLRELTYVEGVS